VSKVCLEYVPEIILGQYTVVHAGFAISIIDEEEARKSLETWQEFIDLRARHGLGPLDMTHGDEDQS
jgi:hydrogenase expression/formation protein HypC